MADTSWRDSVCVMRGRSLDEAMRASPAGRATAFDFTGAGGRATWIGAATQAPGSQTGAHHHGRHEVVIYVVRGRSEIRWGEHLEYVADLEPGDLAYFAPGVPHQERNPSASEPVQFLVIRTTTSASPSPSIRWSRGVPSASTERGSPPAPAVT